MRSLLKWADRIEHPTQAPMQVARAFQEMLSGRRGPVALEMPLDQFSGQGRGDPAGPASLVPRADSRPARSIAALAKLLDEAKAPMLWVGGGAQHAWAEILALAETDRRAGGRRSAAAAASSMTAIRSA